jgi:hypothetical protein
MRFLSSSAGHRAGSGRTTIFFAIGILAGGAASAAPPAAPANVVYTAGPKQMIFKWDIVPRSNYYELWFKANNGAAPVKFDERKPWDPQWRNNVSAHLFNWSEARWEIRACNPSGCSSTGLIDTGSTVVNTVGYVKTPHPAAHARFGSAVAVSEDGRTFAAIASDEPAAEGTAAAVYVFRSNGVGKWSQIGRFVPAFHPAAGDAEGASLALGNDGERIIVALPHESAGGVDDAGVVHVYDHKTTGGWSSTGHFANPTGGHVGAYLQADEAGTTLAYSEDAAGGRVKVVSYVNGHWTARGEITGGGPQQCRFALSRNAQWLARNCGTSTTVEVLDTVNGNVTWSFRPQMSEGYEIASLAADWDATTVAAGVRPRDVGAAQYDASRWKPSVQVFHRLPSGGYEARATLLPTILQSTEYAKRSFFGDSLAVSHDAAYVAVNDPHDSLGRHGSWSFGEVGGAPGTAPPWGAIYVFERAGTNYRPRRHVGPASSPDATVEGVFGPPVLGNNGKTMVLGDPQDDGSRSGIGPYLLSAKREGAGAVWLY